MLNEALALVTASSISKRTARQIPLPKQSSVLMKKPLIAVLLARPDPTPNTSEQLPHGSPGAPEALQMLKSYFVVVINRDHTTKLIILYDFKYLTYQKRVLSLVLEPHWNL